MELFRVRGAGSIAMPFNPYGKFKMKKSLCKLGAGLLIGLPILSPVAQAEEAAAPELTTNIGVVSEYVFRGIRQTWGQPAIQGGIDYVHPSGWYVGTWMSNTSSKLYGGATVEVDLYGGYRTTIADVTYDVGVLQFLYPGANYNKITPANTYRSKSYNTTEVYVSGTWQWLNAKYSQTVTNVGYGGFSNNNAPVGAFPNDPSAGVTGDNTKGSWYAELNANYEFLPTWTVNAHVGHESVANSKNLDYEDYKLGVTKTLPSGWSASLAYSTTSGTKYWKRYPSATNDGTKLNMADDVWIASVNRTF